MIKEEKSETKSLKYHSFLVLTKYIPHFISLCYIIYTLLGFMGIDAWIFGYFVHTSLLPWTYFMLNSYVFRYCYVHRLPLYYILINEIITVSDAYINIPVNDFNLLVIHLLLIGILIFGYTKYYLKYVRTNKKYFETITK